ncbi:hypothetical protein G5C01_06405 [Moraxella bovoculi]|uniref:hypothetical protein n=1 Tax=Moraxella bovoculi TaxID=386891 RepID=UPI00156DE449|nr:hypothetical protein [Moraxella bovoculi]NSM10986.1 hypothetical protein [Moraxella bovoculi]
MRGGVVSAGVVFGIFCTPPDWCWWWIYPLWNFAHTEKVLGWWSLKTGLFTLNLLPHHILASTVARFTPAVRCWYACPCWGGSVLVVGSVGAGAYLC